MREPGFYWIRRNFFCPAEWTIGEWMGNSSWQVVGFEETFMDAEMAELGERITR